MEMDIRASIKVAAKLRALEISLLRDVVDAARDGPSNAQLRVALAALDDFDTNQTALKNIMLEEMKGKTNGLGCLCDT